MQLGEVDAKPDWVCKTGQSGQMPRVVPTLSVPVSNTALLPSLYGIFHSSVR